MIKVGRPIDQSLRTRSGLKLTRLRRRAGWSQTRAAEFLGVSRPTYSRMEVSGGKTKITKGAVSTMMKKLIEIIERNENAIYN